MRGQKTVMIVLASICVVLGAALWAQAQQPQPPRQPQGDGFVLQPKWAPIDPVAPTVLSDGDLGFRVLGMRRQTPVGEWVVRINGEWRPVEVGSAPGLQMR